MEEDGKEERKMKRCILALFLICVGLFVIDSKAAIQYINPNRGVSASNHRVLPDTKLSTELGTFTETANANYSSPPPKTYNAWATQDSALLTDRIIFNGGARSWDQFYHNGTNESLELSGESILRTEFSILESCDISLTGSMDNRFDYGGTNRGEWDRSRAFVNLYRKDGAPMDGGDIFLYIDSRYEGGSTLAFNEQRWLSPAVYVFEAEASFIATYWLSANYNSSFGGGGYSNLNFVLIIPEPASFLLLGLGGLLVRKNRLHSN